MTSVERIPVTVLTGYLGSGKTTLLNRILTEEQKDRIAVIVNEFGEIGIDHQLIIDADEEIVEMNNGCICCTVRGDLIEIVGRLMQHRERFDRLVIETTGLADPGPVIQSFFMDEVMIRETQLDAVVTVIDAKHIQDHWDSEEAQEQIAFADVILINKTDLVSSVQLQYLTERVRGMNAIARIYPTQCCALDLQQILGINAFDLKNALAIDPEFLEEESHEHDQSVYSISINQAGSVDGDKLNRWLYRLVQTRGPDLYRLKGIINLEDEDRRFVFQGVHMTLDGRPGRPWQPHEIRRNELVFIGRNLDEMELQTGFQTCLN